MGKKVSIVTALSGVDGTVSQTSAAIDARYMDDVTVQIIWTGTLACTVAVQGSVDKVNWTTMVPMYPTTLTSPAGTAGSGIYHWYSIGVPWMRVISTPTSGTGTLTALVACKDTAG
jgi:hypothetical protein